MTTMTKNIIGIVVALVIGVAIGATFASHSNFGAINNGAQVQNFPFWFTNGFYGGSAQQFSVTTAGSTVSPCFQTNIGGTNYKMVASSTSLVNGVSTGVMLLSSGTCN